MELTPQEGTDGPPVCFAHASSFQHVVLYSVGHITKTNGRAERASLERFVAKAKRAVGLRGVVNVLVTTSRELRILNSRFRGQDKATDVLSFPPIFGLIADFAGDVAISADIAGQNARRLGHSTAEEIKILALHGILHLAGYDHEHDRGQMARKEARLRKQLNLPGGLIARTSESLPDRSLPRTYTKVGRSTKDQRGLKAAGRNAHPTPPSRRARTLR